HECHVGPQLPDCARHPRGRPPFPTRRSSDLLVVNPLIAFIFLHRNPYPLVLKCLWRSGLTAFFTRSSAANIPVNLKLCEELGLNEDTYAVSIPLGSTINMGGASITISILSLAAAHTL